MLSTQCAHTASLKRDGQQIVTNLMTDRYCCWTAARVLGQSNFGSLHQHLNPLAACTVSLPGGGFHHTARTWLCQVNEFVSIPTIYTDIVKQFQSTNIYITDLSGRMGFHQYLDGNGNNSYILLFLKLQVYFKQLDLVSLSY